MRQELFRSVVATVLLWSVAPVASWPWSAASVAAPEGLIPQAAERLRQQPDPQRALGLAEMYRAAGQRQQSLELLARTAASAAPRQAAPLHLTACWRMLPVDSAGLAGFRRQVEQLAAADANEPWLGPLRLILAAAAQDRQALLQAATGVQPPREFPNVAAEKAHFDLLRELGLPRNTAGLEVIRARAYQPLYALRDLDRYLSREVDFLERSGRPSEAAALRRARDQLRSAWLDASKHLVERLFALSLLGQESQRSALLRQAEGHHPYLQDPKALDQRLAALSEPLAWKSLIEPLLASEVALIAAAPRQPAPAGETAELVVRARLKRQHDGTIVYEGPVEVTFGRLAICCDRMELSADGPKGKTVLNGGGQVVIRGVPGFDARIAAERFRLRSDTGELFLEGDVELSSPGQGLKCQSCTMTTAGEILDSKTLLDEFAAAESVPAKLALLPKITKVYADEQLPPEVAYLLAMKLLRPQLSWHDAYPPPERPRAEAIRREHLAVGMQQRLDDDALRWQEAHCGEEWMLDDVPREKLRQTRQQLQKRIEEEHRRRQEKGGRQVLQQQAPAEQKTFYFWRLKDPQHADVHRAVALLRRIDRGDLAQRARHWLAELGRNNTVLTLDVAGAYLADRKAPVVVDLRNADRLSLKVYRVRRPQDLVGVTGRIGEDFIYRDYGLQSGGGDRLAYLQAIRALDRMRRLYARVRHATPQLKSEDLVHQWAVETWQLEPLDLDRDAYKRHRRWDDGEYGDPEAEYFDDRCEAFRPRLDKQYWPGWEKPSSWQCDRLVEIPAAALKEPGAYILLVEANGQAAYAPIVVDPLGLTLRRCRDGVFVLVGDTEGKQPLAGARIHAAGQLGEAATNADGVAFARVFAAGDRAIIAEKDGRYAVGGFGAVFEGIYRIEQDRERWYDRVKALRGVVKQLEAMAHTYADRYLVAAYTDRPTYRPGQEVNFKIILRRLPAPDSAGKDAAGGPSGEFRPGEFDWADHLEIPAADTELRFDVVNPAGRVVGSGSAKLNDYGTAAGKITLSSEAKVGTYALRVNVGGMDRVVPDAFAVKYYRRPNFELQLAGVPEVIKPGERLSLQLTGRYYFGKPLAGAKANVRLVHPRAWRPLESAEVVLDASGESRLELPLPKKLSPGEYRLIAALSDPSGRTVTQMASCRVEGARVEGAGEVLLRLPRFVCIEDPLEIKTDAKELLAVHEGETSEHRITFKPSGGAITLKLPAPGWYTLTLGEAQSEIFAYGGGKPPWPPRLRAQKERTQNDAEEDARVPRWINLTDYEAEEDGRYRYDRRRDDDDRDTHVLALFERQHVQVGEKLRVLIYTPQHRGRLLLCIEGRTIVDYLLVPLDRLNLVVGGYRVVEIPIKPRYLPNFYLQGRLVLLGDELLADEAAAERLVEKQLQQRALEQLKDEGDGSEDPRWCRVDVIDPAARPGGQRLNVNIQTDEKTYRPGQQVAVRITTTDLKGNPCEAEVSLAAVDESVFSFGEDRLDLLPQCFGDLHPEQRFMRKTWRVSHGRQQVQHLARALAQLAQAQESLKALEMARTMDSLKQLAGIPGPMDLAPPPGVLFGELPAASLSLARLRVDFRETAAWQPQLRTDPGGRLATSLVLPDSLTRYRLTGVGLTRQTDIGIARTRINVTLPLAVQLFLPRFAVERDRLEAVGLLHNNSDRPRTCEVLCEVEGARVEPPDTSGNWRIAPGDGKTQVQGRVAVGAGQSARLTLPLAMDQLDEVKLTLRAADGQHADAEVRTLQVQPLGRPREVALSGTFNGEHQLQLPAGFMALDLRVSIARADVAGALEGLGYLIDYPYGCVEQTMSRFLPAVMVKRAAQESAVSLPPEAAEKLPDVLKKGLERLYNFQHDDGGWGWWEKDQSSPAMTIYVVYGLARCRNTGTEVHAEALRRGCDRLLGLLREGKMPPGDRPGAWLALALAGRADTALLGSDAQAALDVKQPDSATAYLALACRAAGLTEPGEQLAARLRAWEADSTEQLALKVTAQVTFGAPLADCRLTATRLLGRRHGPHWENTRTTAWAIEALSQMLRYDPAAPKPKRITVTVGNKKVLDLRRPEDLDPPVCRVHLDRSGLPKGEALAVRIKVEGEGAMNFTLSATGIQRLDCLQPEGTIIRLERSFSTLDGKPLGGRLRQGDVIAVRLALDLQQAQSYLIVEDRRPAGCEYADEQLAGPAAAAAANVEFRDDRLAAFFTHLPAGRHEIVYYLRAETRGTSNVLPAAAYPMYNDRLKGETGGARLEIE